VKLQRQAKRARNGTNARREGGQGLTCHGREARQHRHRTSHNGAPSTTTRDNGAPTTRNGAHVTAHAPTTRARRTNGTQRTNRIPPTTPAPLPPTLTGLGGCAHGKRNETRTAPTRTLRIEPARVAYHRPSRQASATIRNTAPPTMPRRQGTVSATIRHNTKFPAIAYHTMGQTVKPCAATTKFSRLTGLATIRNIAAPTMAGAPLATRINNSS
jgi:hypothetical protein